MKTKRQISRLLAVLVVLGTLCLISGVASATAIGATLGVSPSHVSVTVPPGGSQDVEVAVHYYTGKVRVTTVGVPVTVTPALLDISGTTPVQITITASTDAQPGNYAGFLRFESSTGSIGLAVNMAVTVNVSVSVVDPVSQTQTQTITQTPKPTATITQTDYTIPGEMPDTGDKTASKLSGTLLRALIALGFAVVLFGTLLIYRRLTRQR